MNLAFEPWIPVIRKGGQPDRASLADVLTGKQNYRDMTVRAHERIALMRLLICVAQAALGGPEKDSGLRDVAERLPDAAARYLGQWRDSFELFHPDKPFLQRGDIAKPNKKKKSKDKSDEEAESAVTSASKLDFALATGANTTLFDHGARAEEARKFGPAQLALMLVTYQNFSPSGTTGRVKWGKVEIPRYCTASPCTPSAMLHGFVRRDYVFDTVLANLLSKEQVRRAYGGSGVDAWGAPIWVRPPSGLNDHSAIKVATETYLGRLVPMSRLIRLFKEGDFILLGNGLEYLAYKDGGMPEPSATIVMKRGGQDRALLGAGSKAIWRELHALSVAREEGLGGALTLRNVRDDSAFDYWVGAFLTNKKNAAEIVNVIESVFHVPAKMLGDAGHAAYQSGIEQAETAATRLGWAVETYRRQVDGGWEGRLRSAGRDKYQLQEQLRSRATRHYWSRLETRRDLLLELVAKLGSEEAETSRRVWRKALHEAARDAYRLVCGMDTPKQMRAYALGWDKLNAVSSSPVQASAAENPKEEETE